MRGDESQCSSWDNVWGNRRSPRRQRISRYVGDVVAPCAREGQRNALRINTALWGMQLTGVELELHFGGPPGPLRDRAFQARRVTGTAAQRWLVPGLPGGEDVAVANRIVAGSEFQHAVEHHAAAA